MSPRTAVIFEESKRENMRGRIRSIVKKEGVSPCHYEPLLSFKSQVHCAPHIKFPKSSYHYFDDYVRLHKKKPGPGTHKYDYQKAYDFLSVSPRELQIKRH